MDTILTEQGVMFEVGIRVRKSVISNWQRNQPNNEVCKMSEKLSTTTQPLRSSTMKKMLFLTDAFETGDAAHIAKSLGIVAIAKGMTQISADTGLSREQLYRSFSEDGNPTLKTMLAVIHSLKIGLTVKSPALPQ